MSFSRQKADAFIAKLKNVFQTKANIVQEISETDPSPDKYPSEKAIKEYIDKKFSEEA